MEHQAAGIRVGTRGGRRKARAFVEDLLARADVAIDGRRASDIRVHDPRLYSRVLAQGSLGAGEAYMDGWWDCDRLDRFFHRVLSAHLDESLRTPRMVWQALLARLINLQAGGRAWEIGRRHYDIGDDLYRRMLDTRLIYSCGYWEHAGNLDEAQEHKLELVFRKLGLESGMRVLDVGCGWGGAARLAAERYGVSVVGVTVSRHQAEYARKLCEGLPVEIRLEDYRALPRRYPKSFDRAWSIGMFEHVGFRNYRRYFEVLSQCLRPDGLFLLHTIGAERPSTRTDPWIERYIFPNSHLPGASQIMAAGESLFVMEDWQNFGVDYDRTLMCWHENISRRWNEIADRYDERFRRMWRYYLLSSAGGFRARRNQLWQIVLAPGGLPAGYSRSERETLGATP